MNLLLINYEYPPVGAGAANATWYMARELAALGHTPTVLTARFHELNGWSEEDGVRVYRCAALRGRRDRSSLIEMASFLLSAFLVLPRIARRSQAQGVIVFFSFPSGPLAWWAHRRWKIPYVVSLRGGDVPGAEPGLARMHRLRAPLRRRLLREARRVVATSEGLK
ncbi:MAG: glycosyltransferase, partial [Methylococcaceae bacterium]|nr:glycosyltransferase [Methylococcaceae bacterium]